MDNHFKYHQCIADLSDELNAVIDCDFIYRAINRKYCELFAKPAAEILGRSVAELHGEKVFNDTLKASFERSLKGERLQIQYGLSTPTQGLRQFAAKQIPLYEQEQIVGLAWVARDLTEHSPAIDELRRYQHIVSAINESLAFLNRDLHYVFANQAYLDLFDLHADDIIGKHFATARGQDLFQTVENRLRRCLQGELSHWQTWGETRHGRLCLDVFYNPYRDINGKITGVVISIRDITSLKQANEALRKYEQIVGASSDLMSFVDRDYIYQAVNQKYIDTYQKPREQIVGHSIYELLGERGFKKVKPVFDQCFAGVPVHTLMAMDWKGEKHHMELRLDPYRNSAGFVTGTAVNVRNVTERVNADDALRALAQATILEDDQEFLYTCVRTLAETYNVDYALIAVYTNKEKSQLSTLAVWNKGERGQNFEYAALGSPHYDNNQFKTLLIAQDAIAIYPEFKLLRDWEIESYFGMPLKTTGGEPIGVISVLHTKTLTPNSWTQPILGIFATRVANELQHKWVEEDLKHLLTILQATLEATADAIVVIGEYEVLVNYNQKFADIWNIPEAILAAKDGVRCLDHILTQLKDPEVLLQQIDAYFMNRETAQTSILECNDGRLLERFAHPYLIKGKIAGRVVSYRDITERKRSQTKLEMYRDHLEELVKARTIELELAIKEIESFSYSVSHDLRSPLRAIDGYSRILMEDYAQNLDDTAVGYLKRSRAASQRMGALIDDLLVLSRLSRRKLRYTDIEMDSMIRNIYEQLQEREPQRQVELVVTNGLCAYGDRQLLRIALENLLGNAWKYTSKHSEARIEIGILKSQNQETERVYFIRDNGVGFDMEYANNIFKAFFRLHSDEEFEGTGIGLATTHKIIERHGGRIWAEGEVGKGATFYFTLPAQE